MITAVESGGECRDVVIQLAAVSKALDRAGYAIVASAMRNCVTDPASESLTPDELEKLFPHPRVNDRAYRLNRRAKNPVDGSLACPSQRCDRGMPRIT